MRAVWIIGWMCVASVARAQEVSTSSASTATTAENAGVVEEPPAEEQLSESEPTVEEEEPSTWDSRGEIAIETRGFLDDEIMETQDYNIGTLARLEVQHTYGKLSERVRLFTRLDVNDELRTTFIVEEAWVQYKSGNLRLRLGVDIVNWTATEAFHPVDIINARNLDGDLENFEKVGEPMAQLQLSLFSDTSVEVLLMPAYMKPRLPSSRTRQSLVPRGLSFNDRILVDRSGKLTDDDFGPQAALRLRTQLGGADVSVHFVEHMDRSQPAFLFDPAINAVRPVFMTVRHLGGTYQHPIDALLVKIEAAYRWFEVPSPETIRDAGYVTLNDDFGHRDHAAVAVGLEYGIVHESGPESTLIVEGQVVSGRNDATRVQLNSFQQDILLGYRLALSDENSTELLVTGIADISGRGELMLSATYGQRIGDVWGLKIGARLFFAKEPNVDPMTGAPGIPTGIQALRDADLIRIHLTRYF
jgi:hypothetical protein